MTYTLVLLILCFKTCGKQTDMLKKWLIFKDLQFLSRFYENWCCYLPHEKLLLFHEFHFDLVKIVGFFAVSHLMGNFSFFLTPT